MKKGNSGIRALRNRQEPDYVRPYRSQERIFFSFPDTMGRHQRFLIKKETLSNLYFKMILETV